MIILSWRKPVEIISANPQDMARLENEIRVENSGIHGDPRVSGHSPHIKHNYDSALYTLQILGISFIYCPDHWDRSRYTDRHN